MPDGMSDMFRVMNRFFHPPVSMKPKPVKKMTCKKIHWRHKFKGRYTRSSPSQNIYHTHNWALWVCNLMSEVRILKDNSIN